jgi:hypothetical protein
MKIAVKRSYSAWWRCASLLFQNVNLAKVFLNLFDALGATGILAYIPSARYCLPTSSVGTTAIATLPQFSKDFSLSVKAQTRSVLEILNP